MGTTASASDPVSLPDLPLGSLLAGLATLLLVFVSVGVIYLSTIEWRDRRRRSTGPSGRS
jgi:hypothetical protein